jgi:hypothetical protein
MTAIEQMVREINGGCFAKVDYSTPNHGLLKTSKVDGSTNPFWVQKDEIRKVVEDCQINLGVVYGNAVNGRIIKKGDVEPDFVSKPMRGKVEHSNPHKNLCMDEKTGTKTYIRYMPMGNKGMTVKYMLNGIDITDAIKLYKSPKVDVTTQAEKGLTGDDQLVWRTLDIANVTALRVLGVEITQ